MLIDLFALPPYQSHAPFPLLVFKLSGSSSAERGAGGRGIHCFQVREIIIVSFDFSDGSRGGYNRSVLV